MRGYVQFSKYTHKHTCLTAVVKGMEWKKKHQEGPQSVEAQQWSEVLWVLWEESCLEKSDTREGATAEVGNS